MKTKLAKLSTVEIQIYAERDNYLGYYKIYKFNLKTRLNEQVDAANTIKEANEKVKKHMQEFVKKRQSYLDRFNGYEAEVMEGEK